ncbi:MAG: NUDIX hydrolase [Chitinophagaceae bacterium]|nr:NUDIX hydrolase [Chitinophagaceae bacterium]
MTRYQNQTRMLVAVDCIVFGFDGQHLKILLIKRGFEPCVDEWSLMGGFVQPDESADEAASRVLKTLTGLSGLYLEQLQTYTQVDRDPIERTVSIAYFALIDIHQYEQRLNDEFHAEWFKLDEIPDLIFDHPQMVQTARQKLRYKAALHPLLFELLPQRFTLPLLQSLFEDVYDTKFDKGNFSRKIISTGMLIKQKEKDKLGSKKGAFYYKLDKKHYRKNFHSILKFIPRINHLLDSDKEE